MKTFIHNTLAFAAVAVFALVPAAAQASDLFYDDYGFGGDTGWVNDGYLYDSYDTGWANDGYLYDNYSYDTGWINDGYLYDSYDYGWVNDGYLYDSYDTGWVNDGYLYDTYSDSGWINDGYLYPSYSGGSYYTPSYSTPSYSTGGFSTPSFSMPSISTPYYPTGGSSSYSSGTGTGTGGSSFATGGTAYSGGNTQNQRTGDVTQIVNIPAQQQQQLQPITITNNNVNTNVNTNTTAAPVASATVYNPPVYVAPTPVYYPPVVQQPAQCSIYATASAYQGGKVTLSWATSGGNNVELYCTGGALANRSVSAISTLDIYPWSSTTCYAVVRSATDSKTCSVYVPVTQPVYTQPTPVYNPPVIYNPQPTVTVASAVVPTYKTITLNQAPYTGFEDYLYPMFLTAVALTAAYAVANRRRLFARA